jgi:pyruvate formate lyase activating enzyme
MKKVYLFERLKNNLVQCQACSWYCRISPGQTGVCGVRQNIAGELFSLVYGKAVGMAVDPIEKKPLFHFFPGSTAFSFGTLGCNFGCLFCQNWFQSQSPKDRKSKDLEDLIDRYSQKRSPQEIVNLAKDLGCQSIAYTYNEPAVFIEYAYETMVLAKKAGLKNVFVSNGYESKETFVLIRDYLDAINIDLKSFNPQFYQKVCQAKLDPVLENIKRFYKAGIWVEVTTLIIPGENDSHKELEQIAKFLVDISPDIPWHVTAFYPNYKMLDKSPTSPGKLLEAFKIGKEAALNYVYVGNIPDQEHSSTYCPKCKSLLISRDGYDIEVVGLKDGRCRHCGQKIAGRWKKG